MPAAAGGSGALVPFSQASLSRSKRFILRATPMRSASSAGRRDLSMASSARNFARVVELQQVLVEQLHAELFAGLNRRVDTERLVFADQVGDGGRDHHELVGGDHAVGIHSRAQRLRQHRQQRGGKLHADLFLLLRREGVDDAVDRAARHRWCAACRRPSGPFQRPESRRQSFRGRAFHRPESRPGPAATRGEGLRRMSARRRRFRAA